MTPNSKVTVTAGGESLSRRPLKTLSMLRGSSESGGRSCRSAIPVRYLQLDDLEALSNDYRVLYSVIISYTISETSARQIILQFVVLSMKLLREGFFNTNIKKER